MLTRDQILGADDLTREKVDVPEWGGFVYVRELTASEKDALDAENYVLKGRDVQVNRRDFKARLLVRSICDDKGKTLFTLKDIQALGAKSLKAMERVAAVALKLSAMSEESQEELAGNLSGGQAEGSPSDSPPNSES